MATRFDRCPHCKKFYPFKDFEKHLKEHDPGNEMSLEDIDGNETSASFKARTTGSGNGGDGTVLDTSEQPTSPPNKTTDTFSEHSYAKPGGTSASDQQSSIANSAVSQLPSIQQSFLDFCNIVLEYARAHALLSDGKSN